MKIIEANNPLRLYTIIENKEILLQVEDNETMLTITKSKRSNKPASKCVILWEGQPEDFATNYKGLMEYGQIDYNKAFINFLNSINHQ